MVGQRLLHGGVDSADLGGGMGELTVVGVAVSPDNVAYPLAKAARVYVGTQEVQERLGFIPEYRYGDPDEQLRWARLLAQLVRYHGDGGGKTLHSG